MMISERQSPKENQFTRDRLSCFYCRAKRVAEPESVQGLPWSECQFIFFKLYYQHQANSK